MSADGSSAHAGDIKKAVKKTVEEIFSVTNRKLDQDEVERETFEQYVPIGDIDTNFEKQSYEDIVAEKELIDFAGIIYKSIPDDFELLEKTAKEIQSKGIYEIEDSQRLGPRLGIKEDGEFDVDSELEIYKYDLKRLAGWYAIATGGLEVRDDFDTYFVQYFDSLAGRPVKTTFYCPILNLDGDFDELELPDEFGFKNQQSRYEIIESKIKTVNTDLICGLFNTNSHNKFSRIDPEFYDRWKYFLEFKVLGGWPSNLNRQYFQSLGRCFRLMAPEEPIVYLGPTFQAPSGPLMNSYGVTLFEGIHPPELKVDIVYTERTYGLQDRSRRTISKDQIRDVRNFVTRYIDLLNPEKDNEITSTLRRYDNMFKNLYVEDSIVDCAIGFEGSLLRDLGHASSSATFRLKYRGGALLQDRDVERERVQNFFKSLYSIRGDIVHQDRNIDQLLSNSNFKIIRDFEDNTDRAVKYSKFARKMLGYTITEYLDMQLDYGLGVTQTNRFLDKKALEMKYDKEELE